MAHKVIVIGVLLMVATALLVTQPVEAKKSKSSSKSSQSNDPCSPNFECKRPGRSQRRRLDREGVDEELNLEDCQSKCMGTILRANERSKRKRKVEEECQCFCLQFHNASCPTTDPAAAFPCLDGELDSCGLKRKTLNRFPVEELQNTDNLGDCQDRCESVANTKGKRLEQCNCLCNYYNVCPGSRVAGSGDEETKTRSKSKTGKKTRSKTQGSGEELGSGSGRLAEEEEETSKSKKRTKAKGSKSRKQY